MTPEEILRNACRAAIDKRQNAPQPYGKIVADLYHSGDEEAYALIRVDICLEVVARLLEAAHAAAGGEAE